MPSVENLIYNKHPYWQVRGLFLFIRFFCKKITPTSDGDLAGSVQEAGKYLFTGSEKGCIIDA